ncbi:protein of unknown function (plasmid) [Caballeronia sp. S22]
MAQYANSGAGLLDGDLPVSTSVSLHRDQFGYTVASLGGVQLVWI